jgi:hypothetical protein
MAPLIGAAIGGAVARWMYEPIEEERGVDLERVPGE